MGVPTMLQNLLQLYNIRAVIILNHIVVVDHRTTAIICNLF